MKVFFNWTLGTLLVLLAFSACGGSSQRQWEMERDSLIDINDHQRQVLDEMTSAIVEITQILDTINVQERVLFSSHDREGRRYTRRQVVENLKVFEGLLMEKRARIHYLDSLMNKSDERLKQLSSLVAYLNVELDKKDSVIQVLRVDLRNKNFNIIALNEKISTISNDMAELSDSLTTVHEKSATMETVIQEQEAKLHTVYYAVGTQKDLSAAGIISGGGLFKKSKVNASALSAAIQIDYRTLKDLEIEGKKPQILTDMPTDSYELLKISQTKHRLHILDPQKFWSVSKMLVILVK